ncbi:autophagy protein atg9 [Spiromyces aspiralis]|uniref:Autophagy protein atg9 n=1 Tax=Spiromyces aspiralis TaxID=68401 RepID=A0ACC1HWL8_9FUNG|nr:autophagy protein atg9 [Spiromyces aspiralis]
MTTLLYRLRRRFMFMGVINLMFAPFIVVFLVIYSFFRYFEEIYRDPGTVVSRAYTPHARWQFRNYNELPHAFNRRVNRSFSKASAYLGRFRNETVVIVARFIAFIAGSFAAVLLLMSVVDNELSLEFEITPNRTVLFYIGLFGTIIAACRSAILQDDDALHPAWILRDVLEDLQYMPDEWRGKLHTTAVRKEFERLFAYKALTFVEELASVLTTPIVLMTTLPRCSESIIDFFRLFTTHVDHLGYVCGFATFNFERHGDARYGAPARAHNEQYVSRYGKMEQSFLAFKAEYPEWEPRDQAGSIYLQRVEQAQHTLPWRQDGWQKRVLQQQDMAGSVLPTGQSLYRAVRRASNVGGIPQQQQQQPIKAKQPATNYNNHLDSVLHQTNALFNPTLGRMGLAGGGSTRGAIPSAWTGVLSLVNRLYERPFF